MGFIYKIKQFFSSKTEQKLTDNFAIWISPMSILEYLDLEDKTKKHWKDYLDAKNAHSLLRIYVNLGYKLHQEDGQFRRCIDNNWVNEIKMDGLENSGLPKEFIEEVRQIAVNIAKDRLYEEFRIMGRWM